LGSSGSLLAQGVLDPNAWHIAYATAPLGADQIVEAQLRVVDFYDASPSSMAALFARYDPGSDSGYLVALRGDGTVIVRRRDRGVTASWGGGVAAGIRTGTWYTVRLEVLGDAINAFIDGQPVYSVTDDAPLTTGGLALGSVGATLEVDRVAAADLSAPKPE
jgi:pectate lyase